MIPLRDVIPSRTVPVLTVTIIIANAIVFLFEQSLSRPELRALVMHYGVVPAFFSWPTILTSMFLHADWLHIGGNMLFLWIFGDNVEDRFGHGRFLVFYLLCGTAAAIAQVLVMPGSTLPTIGASGAIAGVMGAYLVMYPQSRILTFFPPFFFFELPALFFLGVWFLMQLLSGVGSVVLTTGSMGGGIAFWAHIAGFLTGVLGVGLFRRPDRQRVEWWSE